MDWRGRQRTALPCGRLALMYYRIIVGEESQTSLTSRLALEIFQRGKVPFYCAAWSNICFRYAMQSAVAFDRLRAELTAKPIEEGRMELTPILWYKSVKWQIKVQTRRFFRNRICGYHKGRTCLYRGSMI